MSIWFRLHTDILNNPKVQTLPHELFKAWVNILCCAKLNDGVLPSFGELAFRLRCTEATAEKWANELHKRKLLDRDGDGPFTPHDWQEHQYEKDQSAERVKRYRDRKRNASCNGNVTGCNAVTVTLPRHGEQSRADIQSRAEAEPLQVAEIADRMYALHPKKSEMVLVPGELEKAFSRGHKLADIEACHKAWCESADWKRDNSRFAPRLAHWIADDGFTRWPTGREPPVVIDPKRIIPFNPAEILKRQLAEEAEQQEVWKQQMNEARQ